MSQSEVIALEVAGLRLAGEMTPVTVNDRFHIGSNTEAWTATVGANLVNDDGIRWDALPREVFDQPVLPEYEEFTFEMLLRHKGPEDSMGYCLSREQGPHFLRPRGAAQAPASFPARSSNYPLDLS